MLKSLRIRDFTVFKEADLTFAGGLNVIVGANGTGKSHLLKLPYAVMAMSAEGGRKRSEPPTKTLLQTRIADKIHGVFRPEERLGRLVHRQRGHNKCEVEMRFGQPEEACLAFSFSSVAQSKVSVTSFPSGWQDKPPVFLPTRELLTLYPGFVSLYKTRYLELNLARHLSAAGCSSLERTAGRGRCPLDGAFGGADWRTGCTGCQQRSLLLVSIQRGQDGNATGGKGMAQAGHACKADRHRLPAGQVMPVLGGAGSQSQPETRSRDRKGNSRHL